MVGSFFCCWLLLAFFLPALQMIHSRCSTFNLQLHLPGSNYSTGDGGVPCCNTAGAISDIHRYCLQPLSAVCNNNIDWIDELERIERALIFIVAAGHGCNLWWSHVIRILLVSLAVVGGWICIEHRRVGVWFWRPWSVIPLPSHCHCGDGGLAWIGWTVSGVF